MNNSKFKVMTEKHIAELDKLVTEGHGEAMFAFGLECAETGVEAYERGQKFGQLLVVATVVLGAGAIYVGKKVYQKLKRKNPELCDPDITDTEE